MAVNLKHITKNDRQQVYPPSQDTFLLIDSVVSDLSYIQQIDPCFVIEIGVGSGAVLTTLAMNQSFQSVFIGVDINPKATLLAKSTLELNNCKNYDIVNGDIFRQKGFFNKIDVIICNPPYVITSKEEFEECQKRKDISSSFAGGEDGREFIDKLFDFAYKALSDKGVMYMLFEEHNGSFPGKVLSEQRVGCEGLAVIRMGKEQIREALG
ncbi:hypothetical protein SteCoe_26965 [Stentor coeruleus]|uniref:Methyltransferase small domain-containing protein n=1 Tax=Stentor coeruleus TaxID=5963 RepID=A0A1R2BC32_9CILI|nr:hypothetical protein SteCoe_26965 [Stentor coeruleus]